MPGDEIYELQIDAFTPESIPMSRLAEYMADFAALLGHKEYVHFTKLKSGSLSIVSWVDPVAQNKVFRRLEEVRFCAAARVAMEASRSIDDKLVADNAVGRIVRGKARVIEFPGRARLVEATVGPVVQADTIDGEVIQIGGRDETINVHLKAGDEIHFCVTSKAVARRLAQHIFGAPVRVRGKATWSRKEPGGWKLHRFEIENFDPLDETPLSKVFEGLRARLAPPEGGRPNPVVLAAQLREE
jgi:hypothetical protein